MDFLEELSSSEKLYSYTNGNSKVTIYSDGTKSRYSDGPASPIYPESLDVKITNYCDAGCKYCHEQSTIDGYHGDLSKLSEVLSVLPAGVEIAIGGGNPVSHPNLMDFLLRCKSQGLVCNMTINQRHILQYQDLIANLLKDKFIYGLGISYVNSKNLSEMNYLLSLTDNVVFHMIMGVNKVSDLDLVKDYSQSQNKECKVLILGYKKHGFGLEYYLKSKKIEDNIYNWYTQLVQCFGSSIILSFDNLAIEQLKLNRYFAPDLWNTLYMGKDGDFSMYIDAVEQKYATSSTSNNKVGFDVNLIDFFKEQRQSRS